MEKNLTLVCISDTHTHTKGLKIPEGDILIHAGDFSKTGLPNEIIDFNNFLKEQPHKYKIVIAGNHDLTFDTENYPFILKAKEEKKKPNFPLKEHKNLNLFNPKELLSEAIYLEDSWVEINGLKFYGSPWSPARSLTAFKLKRGPKIAKKWEQIPENIDVLITHTPPYGILDLSKTGDNAGCEDLTREIFGRIKPKAHIFGHIHDSHGYTEKNGIKFVNASSLNKKEATFFDPIVITLN